ncbi:CRP-like cAMP-binding protein [Sphingomonas sp. BK036]|uniref:Crp/Fnr family transcriptional regulator n=1 Tax=Sphingomonas sp. BK036 TaxID=2512122 RepID=UPI0010E7E85B|nr:Crp/Fnr family transcriptional regulator [Sphingomonas sp. BK036]RZT46324.1 CRP-like cAMP-binding protein [Sphingomonas sp. BK036]
MKSDSASPLVGLVEKLALHAPISHEDRIALIALPYASRSYDAGSYLIHDNGRSDRCSILVSGFAYRHKTNAAGQRQIVSMLLAGEIYDLQQLHLPTADSSVQTLTRCEVVTILHTPLRQLLAKRPSVAHALFSMALVELSISREWTLNIGRRDARTRTAHFLCEMAFRLEKGGIPHGQPYELPMSQQQLGDALGLTTFQIRRAVKTLVTDGLIVQSKRSVTIPDWDSLVTEAEFGSQYMHMLADRSMEHVQ